LYYKFVWLNGKKGNWIIYACVPIGVCLTCVAGSLVQNAGTTVSWNSNICVDIFQSGEVKESVDQRFMISVSVADDDRFVCQYDVNRVS
jgi:hypothetical protein